MDRRADMMRHFPKLLGRWKGAHARLWNLTESHPTLTILLTKDGAAGCLLISCVSPNRIEAPRHWDNSNIQVELDSEMFRVIDESAQVRILDCGVAVREMEKKPWET